MKVLRDIGLAELFFVWAAIIWRTAWFFLLPKPWYKAVARFAF
ncbi:hypothetical protein PAECIP111802_06188 [Paenibacillus allorhizosphaerae]|uniref:Uncharacterized protein n=1 Tax=Paenibacillus allorhizosphaerae TaxID=2849866 RepID=A0ABM8VRT9_9BACL|nr:hypothetical protein PAECIP111802_06188 [Paenibacillus allorhizosphaerae]